MSLEERLARALEAGEHERCEFRRSFGKEALRTLCAFANTKGGELWIGVKDDGEIVGASTGREGLRDWAHRIREELGARSSTKWVKWVENGLEVGQLGEAMRMGELVISWRSVGDCGVPLCWAWFDTRAYNTGCKALGVKW